MNDLISLVVPIYNVESFLSDCFDSIQNQTYKNIEIILINDGSTDKSVSLCKAFMEIDPRVKLIHQDNSGLSGARNSGIDIANGKYITFIDSDDFISLDYIEVLYNLISQNNADISVCQREEVDESGAKIKDQKVNPKNENSLTLNGRENLMEFFLKEHLIDTVAWGKLYKRSLFNKIRYPIGKFHEDVFTTYKIIAECETVTITYKRNYFYRIRKSGISKSSFQLKHLDSIEGSIQRALFIKSKFPSLLTYANALTIYATNQCLIKLGISKNSLDKESYEKTIAYMQQKYRDFELDYIKSKSSIYGKLFSIFAFINVRFTLLVLRIISKVR